MPDLCKIGKTTRDPLVRVRELSSATGVPTPFILVFWEAVSDCGAAEIAVHDSLELAGYRLSRDREFFEVPVDVALRLMLPVLAAFQAASQSADGNVGLSSTVTEGPTDESIERANELLALADQYETGTDSILRNPERALMLYEQSSALGNPSASYLAGRTYARGTVVKKDAHKAMTYFRKAASNGVTMAHPEMAELFREAGQLAAAAKCYVDCYAEQPDADSLLLYLQFRIVFDSPLVPTLFRTRHF